MDCLIFRNLLSISEPQFLHLENENPTSNGCVTYKVFGTYTRIIQEALSSYHGFPVVLMIGLVLSVASE